MKNVKSVLIAIIVVSFTVVSHLTQAKTIFHKTTATVGSKQNITISQKLIGMWMDKIDKTGDGNVTFVIRKSDIYYPDHLKAYKYEIVGHSIKVYYTDFVQSFPFKFKDDNTLILTGDDGEQVFHRKNKK